MFSFLKKKKDTQVPKWASFFTNKEFNKFNDEVHKYFSKLNISFSVYDGIVHTNKNEFGFEKLGLVNVAQTCKQNGERSYKQIIEDHFESMIRSNKFDKEFEKIVDDFDKAKEYIGVRIYDNDYVDHVGKSNTIGKNFIADMYIMVVFDFPDSILNVQPDQAEKWHKSTEELIEIGKQNIKKNYPVEISKENMGEFSIVFMNSSHFFTPNVALEIESIENAIGTYGTLVGLPHRHSALFYPINDFEVVRAVNGLIQIIYRMNQEGPGSLSNKLLWYKDGKFTDLPYLISQNKFKFTPPSEFVDLLNKLK